MTAWEDRAACRDHEAPDLWHPTPGDKATEAKSICAECPVMQECAQVAITDPTLTGVWGGLTDRERAVLRQKKPRRVAQCGTHSGYVRHQNRKEAACDPCKAAKAAYVRARYYAADKRRQALP